MCVCVSVCVSVCVCVSAGEAFGRGWRPGRRTLCWGRNPRIRGMASEEALRSGVAPRPSYLVLGAEPKNPRDGSRRGPAVGGGAPPAVFFVAGWGPENPLMDERAQRQVHRALYKFSIPPDCQGGSKMLAGPAEATLRGDNISAPPGNQEGGISVLEGPCFLMP